MVHLKRALKVCATLAVLALSLWFVNAALIRYDDYNRHKTFMKSKTDYDVIFLGTSHVRETANPMQLWNKYGITSYNLGSSAASIPMSYWMLRFAKDYHKPKLAMIDVYGLWYSFKDDMGDIGSMHTAFDTFPLFQTKWQAMHDLCVKDRSRAELVFPFCSYHNRWKEIGLKAIMENMVKGLRGYYKTSVTKGLTYSYIGIDRGKGGFETNICYEGTESTSMEYCRRFIAWCKENGIIPIFMLVPYAGARTTTDSSENTDTWLSALRLILEKEGVLFLDMLDGVVDFDIDKYEDSHLNPSGARKVTDAIGAFLSETLGCQSHKDDPAFAAWHGDYDAYRQWLLGTIARQGDFKNLLMMTNHAEVYAAVRAGNNAAFDAVEEKLLFENWSDIRFERTGAEDAAVTVTVFERGTDRDVVTRRFEKR